MSQNESFVVYRRGKKQNGVEKDKIMDINVWERVEGNGTNSEGVGKNAKK